MNELDWIDLMNAYIQYLNNVEIKGIHLAVALSHSLGT